jgi:hypothetical protein
VSTKATSVFKDLEIAETLSTIYDKYGVVPADKVPNNKHYIDCLSIVLGLYSSQANPTYIATKLSKEDIIDNHKSVLSSFGLSLKDDDCDLLLLY